jgi:hypothetical protein
MAARGAEGAVVLLSFFCQSIRTDFWFKTRIIIIDGPPRCVVSVCVRWDELALF